METTRDTVLFVDDEPSILSAISRATSEEHFTAIFVKSGQEALRIFEERPISVIVTDMRMPGMDGLALLKIIREKYPSTVRMVLSGYTQLSQVLVTVNQGEIFQFIPKPWQMEEELLMPVRRAIDRYNLEVERKKLQTSLAKKNQVYQKILLEMEQRKANEQRELSNLKRINRWIFDFWKRNNAVMAASKSEINLGVFDGYVNLIEEIQLMYMAILPVNFEQKKLSDTITFISKECGWRIAFGEDRDDTRVFGGYPGVLAMLFKVLLYVMAPNEQIIACEVAVNTSTEGALFISFSFDKSDEPLLALEQSRLKVGCSLLNEISKIYNIAVNTEVLDGGFAVVKVIWLLKDENSNT